MPKKMIRVLQIGMSTSYGGTEAVVYSIYRVIDRSKVQFDFLNVYDKPLARQDWLESLGARTFSLKLKRREGYFKYLRGIKSFYKEHAKEFDAVVCNVQCLDQIAMAKYAKKSGIARVILHLHNSNYGIQPSRLARIAIRWNKRHCHKYVDRFVACSSLAALWGYPPNIALKCIVLKQGIDIERFSFSAIKRNAFRLRYGYSTQDVVFGSIGRMDPQKNHLFLVDIFTEIGSINVNARFILVGSGPLADEIRAKIALSPVADRIMVIPAMTEVEFFYSGIDCFILPSKFEGLGMVLIEAQCSGLPCLATADTIPAEAKIGKDFRFLSLDAGPSVWASVALDSVKTICPRDDAYSAVASAGRDIMETIEEYNSLLI